MDHEDSKNWMFDGSNIDNWMFRMKIFLEERNLYDCVIKAMDEEPYAVDLEADTAAVKAEKAKKREDRIQRDRKCKSAIVHRIAESQLEYVKDKESAKDMWDTLCRTFQQKGFGSQIFLRRKLLTMRLQEDASVQSHLLEFDKLLRDLKASGARIDEQDAICYLMLTLPSSYDPLVTALDTVEPDRLNIEFVKNRLLHEERRRVNKHVEDFGGTSVSAFIGKKGTFNFKCYNGGKTGHKRSECKEKSDDWNRDKKQSKRYRKPNGKANIGVEGDISFLATYGNEALVADEESGNSKIEWYADSGASNHMLNSEVYFEELHKLPEVVRISIAKNGEFLETDLAGTVRAETVVNGVRIKAVLREVLYVPKLSANLFSVRRVEQEGMKVTFYDGEVLIEKDGRLVATGKRGRSLYKLEMFVAKPNDTAMAAKVNEFELWHRRFGHLGEGNLKKLWTKSMVQTKSSIDVIPERGICEVCVAGKQVRKPFEPVCEVKSRRPLELIHTDVCGSFNPNTWNHKRYFVSFIDDYTHFTVVYLIASKDEVMERFLEYRAKVTAYFGTKIARLRCDNGGEYASNAFQEFCRKEGISIEFTVPYSPQQNGVAERMNRTLLDKARAMILDANLPKTMWGEAVLSAVYLVNRSPTTALRESKTPYEMWYQKKPDVDQLRVFGSIAYTHIPKQQRGKLDARSERNVMVGYASNGYRIWNARKKKLFISRDVVFDETRKISKPECLLEVEEEHVDIEPQHVPAEAEEPEELNDTAINQEDDVDGNLDSTLVEDEPEEQARPKRHVTTPAWHKDYKVSCNVATELTYALNAETFIEDIPNTVEKLRERDDWRFWKQAIESELDSLRRNETWALVPRPPGKNVVDCKWVFRVKRDKDGNVDRYKARLVAKGYSQRKDFDYSETYAPVARITTVRVLLAIANQRNYHIHQMDVKTAFLNGLLKEEMFMEQPEGYEEGSNLVCRLQKSLYGLKQAPRSWNEAFNTFVMQLGFQRSNYDSCLYWIKQGNNVAYLLLYVDDILLVSNSLEEIKTIKIRLSERFDMTDMRETEFFLGLKIERNLEAGKLKVSQPKYVADLLQRFGMASCNPVSTPMETNLKLEQNKTDEITSKPYKELIGCLTYLMISSRPDISAAVSYFSQFQAKPLDEHWIHLKRVLRYLKGTETFGLLYRRDESVPSLVGFADSDWANEADRRSISGNVFQVYGSTVSWSTKKQCTVALSSTEAEYVSISQAACEAIWLRNLLSELGVNPDGPTVLFEDNQSCIHVTKESRDHKRMKHIDIKYNFIRQCVQNGTVRPVYINTKEQAADIFTKGLSKGPFQHLRNKLGLFG